MKTYQIHIQGKVQGVGFRPFVYQLAHKLHLKGWVTNGNDGVKIKVSGKIQNLTYFIQKLQDNKPSISRITSLKKKETQFQEFDDFQIIPSQNKGKKELLLTADLDTCPECLEEFYNPQSRFFHYPFISCTNCGTRYSIIQELPYDREKTAMKSFEFCPDCETEYHDPTNRRFYAQTHSCSTCGIELNLYNAEKEFISKNFDAVNQAIELLKEGKILAIKGIGGFLIMADTQNLQTIQTLRQRKYRPSKPFALMYPNVEKVAEDVILNNKERNLLESREKPILLLKVKKSIKKHLQLEAITPKIEPKKLGIMLPYTALFDYILKKINRPLIATSGNISQSPIIFENENALENLTQIADFILTNNRQIIVPQDDSVIRFSSKFQQRIILRRSRSFAPNYNLFQFKINSSILALGALLKSSFTLSHEKNIYISQYLGNLIHFDTQVIFQKVLSHFINLFEAKPEVILTDKHPNYFSTQFGEELAQKWEIPHHKIQHHKAHFWAVLGENQLLEKDKILGIIWDGTGLGNDGQIWGGEFFSYENQTIKRLNHFAYFPHILGDKMATEPRISALSLVQNNSNIDKIAHPKFSEFEWKNYQKVLQNPNNLHTSSIGRLFDAVGSLLGLGDKQTFEGEVAMHLEALAQDFYDQNPNFEYFYSPTLDTKSLVQEISEAILQRENTSKIAFQFHLTLIKIIKKVAQEHQIQKLAFSGGVWQNALLVDLAIKELAPNFELYFHKELSPNDENISFGQMMAWLMRHKK